MCFLTFCLQHTRRASWHLKRQVLSITLRMGAPGLPADPEHGAGAGGGGAETPHTAHRLSLWHLPLELLSKEGVRW